MKKKIVLSVCVIALFLSIVLIISLLSTKVYKGTYSYKDDSGTVRRLTFYENTYDATTEKNGKILALSQGYYKYAPKETYEYQWGNDIMEQDTIILNHGDSGTLYRNSVFSIHYRGQNETYKCTSAIFLLVLYIGIALVSGIFLSISINRNREVSI